MTNGENVLLREEYNCLKSRILLLEEIIGKTPIQLFIDQINCIDNVHSVQNIWMNECSHNFIGYTRHELNLMVENYLPAVIHPDDIEEVKNITGHLNTLPDGDITAGLCRIKPKNGDYKQVLVLYSIFKRNPDGTPLQMLNAAIELTHPIITQTQMSDALKEITRQNNLQKIKKITRREAEILKLIAQGFTDKAIAEKLFVSVRTIKTHRYNLIKKIGVSNTAALVAFTVECGLH